MKKYICRECGAKAEKVHEGEEELQVWVRFKCGRVAYVNSPVSMETVEEAPCPNKKD